MRKLLSHGLVLVAGLCPAPSLTMADVQVNESKQEIDQRLVRLHEFFDAYGCPLHNLAQDFLDAADNYGLDWRLLPSIALVESGGGKNYMNNNIFGWDSARKRFPTVRDGIHTVAHRLAHSKLYQGKGLNMVLATYNQNSSYPPLVKYVMRQLDATEPVQ